MSNWMDEKERRQDEARENQINKDLNSLINQYENTSNMSEKQELLLLRSIVNLYKTLKSELCEYNKEDYEAKSERLEELEGIIMKQKHDEQEESNSWNEYREEKELIEKDLDDER